jgi:HSP20 family protein
MSAGNDSPQHELETREPYFHIQAGGRQYLVVRTSHVWRPPTDVMEDENRLYIIVEIAGMQQGEFNVALSDRRLIITGIRPMPTRVRAAYHQLEVHYGEFRTDVSLPWVADEDGIVARYEDGFLYIELPRSQQHTIRVVSVDKSSRVD